MIKSSTFAIAAALAVAAATQLVGPQAVAQTTTAPKSAPGFGPKDLPEPVGPALVPAQTAPTTMPPPSTMTAPVSLSLTDAQAKAWIDKAVYSSDDKKIGEIAAFARDGSGNVTEMHADIGGFFGMGETRIRLMPAQFKMGTDRVVLSVTAEQAKVLPTVKK